MVEFLIDSDVIINFLKGKEDAKQIFQRVKLASGVAVSVITIAEVLEGVIDNPKRLREAEDFLSKFEKMDINIKIAKVFSRIRSFLRKSGKLIDNMDLLIASTALANNLILITGNKKDYQRINELKLL